MCDFVSRELLDILEVLGLSRLEVKKSAKSLFSLRYFRPLQCGSRIRLAEVS